MMPNLALPKVALECICDFKLLDVTRSPHELVPCDLKHELWPSQALGVKNPTDSFFSLSSSGYIT